MDFSFLSLIGHWCSLHFHCTQVFQHQLILSTFLKTHSQLLMMLFIFKQDTTFYTPSLLSWISFAAHSTGSCSAKSSNKSMAAMKILDGADLFIWNLYIQYQELLALSTQLWPTASWRKIIGNSLHIWPLFTDYSVGHISFQLEYNNIHSWTSNQEKHSKTYFGLTSYHALYTLSSARSTRESNQSTREVIFILIVKSTRETIFEIDQLSFQNLTK